MRVYSELKRRQKQREKEAQKAAKAAAAPPQTKKENEEDLSPSQYYERRVRTIQQLRETRNPDPYPHKFHVSTSLTDFIEKYESRVEAGKQLEGETVSLAGRIHNMRSAGAKLRFYDLHAEGVTIQITASLQDHKEGDFAAVHDLLRRGDIVGVKGTPGKTKSGELSIFPSSIQLLSPNLHMLPKATQGGFTDTEARYRKRYLDLIMNNNVRDIFIKRAKIINYVRRECGRASTRQGPQS